MRKKNGIELRNQCLETLDSTYEGSVLQIKNEGFVEVHTTENGPFSGLRGVLHRLPDLTAFGA